MGSILGNAAFISSAVAAAFNPEPVTQILHPRALKLSCSTAGISLGFRF